MASIRKPRRRPFVRREIWALERTNTWDPITLGLAKAIQTMKGLQFPQDQTNYEYQASLHGSNTNPGSPGPGGVWEAPARTRSGPVPTPDPVLLPKATGGSSCVSAHRARHRPFAGWARQL